MQSQDVYYSEPSSYAENVPNIEDQAYQELSHQRSSYSPHMYVKDLGQIAPLR